MDSPTGSRPFGGVPKLGRMRDSICIFALWGKNKGVAGPLPGVLHLDGFESPSECKKPDVYFYLAFRDGKKREFLRIATVFGYLHLRKAGVFVFELNI